MTAVLQISDTHIVAEGKLVSGRLQTAKSLERLIARIAGIREQIGEIDAVLFSGDVSDDGDMESYRRFQKIVEPLRLPAFVIPGNHDCRETMREAFAPGSYLPESGRLNWRRRIGDIQLIGIDTLIEGRDRGVIDQPTLDFLETALDDSGKNPTLLALHHPPFNSGIAFMDAIGLDGIASFAQLLARRPGEIRVVCGHIHCTMVMCIGGKVAISAPSPCSSFPFDVRAGAPAGFMQRENGFLLHRWKDGFQSIHIPMDGGAGLFPF